MTISSTDTVTGLCITFPGKANVYSTQTGTDQRHTKEINPTKSGLVSQESHCSYLQEQRREGLFTDVWVPLSHVTSQVPGPSITNAASLEFPDSISSEESLPPLRLSTVSVTLGKKGSWLLSFLGDIQLPWQFHEPLLLLYQEGSSHKLRHMKKLYLTRYTVTS